MQLSDAVPTDAAAVLSCSPHATTMHSTGSQQAPPPEALVRGINTTSPGRIGSAAATRSTGIQQHHNAADSIHAVHAAGTSPHLMPRWLNQQGDWGAPDLHAM